MNRNKLAAAPFVFLALTLILGLVFARSTGHAATDTRQVRVLTAGGTWQVEYAPGEYAYQIEYLAGDMFVTVEARFLGEDSKVVHSTTHTLVQNSRMSAQRTFHAGKVGDGVSTTAICFECGSGKARVTFGAAKDLKI